MLNIEDKTGCAIIFMFLSLILLIMAFFDDVARIIFYVAEIPLILVVSTFCKKIQMTKDWVWIKIFFWKRFFHWHSFQTIRLLDFGQCNTYARGGHYYSEGVFFYTRRIPNYPIKLDPPSYFILHDPFCHCGFYVQFPPKESYEKKDLGMSVSAAYSYGTRREEFMACAEEWGLKIEGWNVPMPASQIKKRRRW